MELVNILAEIVARVERERAAAFDPCNQEQKQSETKLTKS